MRAQVDQAADAAFDLVGGWRLVDIGAAEQFRRQVLEGHAALLASGEDVAAIEQRLRLGQAAHLHGIAFATVARNLHASDPLQRLGHVGVGQLADVVGDDGIDDLVGGALAVLRLFKAGLHAGYDDGVELGVRRGFLGQGGHGAGEAGGNRDQVELG